MNDLAPNGFPHSNGLIVDPCEFRVILGYKESLCWLKLHVYAEFVAL